MPEEAAEAPTHRSPHLLPLTAAVIATLVVWLALDDLPVGGRQDDAMYVILARALASGEGYRFTHLVGAPPGVHFPPGYPFFLAILGTLRATLDGQVAMFKAANALLMGASAGMLVVMFRERTSLPSWIGFAVALLGAAGMPALFIATPIMSEPLFLVGLLILLRYGERTVAADHTPDGVAFALGVGTGALTLVRTLGVPVVVGLAALLWIRGRRRAARIVVAGAALLLAPWLAWSSAHQGQVFGPWQGKYGSYGQWIGPEWASHGLVFVAASMRRTLDLSGSVVALQLSPWRSGIGPSVVLVITAGLLAAGCWAGRRRFPLTLAFLSGYAAIVLLWPFWPDRFIWTIWPILLLLLALGVQSLWSAGRVRRLALASIVLVFATSQVRYTVEAVRGEYWHNMPVRIVRVSLPAVDWVRRNASRRDLIATDIELMVGLYAGNRTIPMSVVLAGSYLHAPDIDAVAAAMQAGLLWYEPDVVVLATAPWTRAAERFAGPGGLLQLRDTLPAGGRVYRYVGKGRAVTP